MTSCADEALRLLTGSPWFENGRGSAEAYFNHEKWLNRRVETIEFSDERSVKRSISVDFSIPSGLPSAEDQPSKDTALVPISVLQKWPPLMGFDFIGPTGHPTSRYLGDTNKQLDFGLLLGMVDKAFAHGECRPKRASWELRRTLVRRFSKAEPMRLPLSLLQELAEVVHSPQPRQSVVASAVNGLRGALDQRLDSALDSERQRGGEELARLVAATVDLAARLAASSILWVAVQGRPKTDQIVKFSYIDEYNARMPELFRWRRESEAGEQNTAKALWNRISIACSWQPRKIFIPLPHAGRHVRFHLDIPAPSGGVEFVGMDARAFPAAEGAEDPDTDRADRGGPDVMSVDELAGIYEGLDLPDEWVGPASSLYYMAYGEPVLLASTSQTVERSGSDRPEVGKEASADIAGGRAHLYLGSRRAPSHRVYLQAQLAASHSGLIRGCTAAAWVIAALMFFTCIRLAWAAEHLEATVVLLSVVPVVLGYVLVTPDESALERDQTIGVRLMTMASGALPIMGALALILLAHTDLQQQTHAESARPVWLALAIASGLLACGLSVSFYFTRGRKRRRERI